MKRTIGMVVGGSVMAAGATVLSATASSALPRDPCMDATNYWEQASWYETQTDNYFDQMLAWQNADHYLNPLSGQETWTAYGSSGTTSVFNLTDYNHKLGSSQSDYSTMYAAMVDFETNTAVC
jgi:hypothetical protein